jgi:hypothetical protein
MNYSDAALDWITVVLYERFGVNVLLKRAEQGIELSIHGAKGRLLISAEHTDFSVDSTIGQMQYWDPESEGFSSAIPRLLPLPYLRRLEFPIFQRAAEEIWAVNYDLIGLIYWMLTRKEEVGSSELDSHNRFPATASHAFKNGYLDRPIVDEWLHILGQIILRVWSGTKIKQHNFKIKVSHDVDRIAAYSSCSLGKFAKASLSRIVKRRDISALWNALLARYGSNREFSSRDPLNTFNWIMDCSERHSIKSAFYFICGRTDISRDATYEIEQPAVRNLLRRIHGRGHEIGLHPSYNTYLSPVSIAEEALRLKSVCREEGIEQEEWGGRMHFLRWESPTTFYGWVRAGFNYDSSLGYADHPGFRCGTCFTYPAFDPINQCKLNLRVVPLIAMECTIMSERYMGLGATDSAFSVFENLKNACRSVGGVYTLLWHNTQLVTDSQKSLYERIIQ